MLLTPYNNSPVVLSSSLAQTGTSSDAGHAPMLRSLATYLLPTVRQRFSFANANVPIE
jgi:hypothetical protein